MNRRPFARLFLSGSALSRLALSRLAPPRTTLVCAMLALSACQGENPAPTAATAAAPVLSAADACAQLAGTNIPATAIGLPTSGASITSAELVASDTADNQNGEFCKVLGAIHPAMYTAPDINFEVNLPSNWNNKTLQFGGGGFNGNLVTGLGRPTLHPADAPTPLASGYVTLGSDSGHQSTIQFDGNFLLNSEAMDNFGHMQIKKTHDVAMQLVQQRYGHAPARNYFIGGSTGGHEGFDAVQRYPEDYDGVVAGYPAHNVVMLHLAALNFAKAFMAEGAYVNPTEAAFLVSKVYEACDALDAAADGIISNAQGCRAATASFKLLDDSNPIRCAGGRDGGDACLSDAQLTALNTVDEPYETGFPIFNDDTGTAVFPKWTPFEGSTFKDGNQAILGAENARGALQATPGDATSRFAIAQDLTINPFTDFDPKAYAARVTEVATRISANSPVIDRFQARGGKLIYFHGLVDDFITPYSSLQYHERLVKRYGKDELAEFVRFYTIPGMGHGSGIVYNPRLVLVDVLDAWVERGEAPGTLVAPDVREGSGNRTRPICEYPGWPRYNGTGDINNASSFACVVE